MSELMECPDCGVKLSPRGIGSHRAGALCEVEKYKREMARKGLVFFAPAAEWLAAPLLGVINDAKAEIPHAVVPGIYQRGQARNAWNPSVISVLFVPPWMPKVYLALCQYIPRELLIRFFVRMNADPEFRVTATAAILVHLPASLRDGLREEPPYISLGMDDAPIESNWGGPYSYARRLVEGLLDD